VKRFVYVPPSMMGENVPEEAINLSSESQLSIRIGDEDDGIPKDKIGIVSFPDIDVISCEPSVKLGFVHSLDYSNDFVDFNENTLLKVKHSNGDEQITKPSLCEKHKVKFRSRFYSSGTKEYFIETNQKTIISGKFEVYET
jgi:hypothetical protein